MRQFLSALRNDPRYKYCQLVSLIEAQMSWVASGHHSRYFQAFPPYAHLSRDTEPKGTRAGVPTTPELKLRYIIDTSLRLSVGALRFAEDLVCINEKPALDQLRKQMQSYAVDEVMPLNPAFQQPKYGAAGKNGPNDAAMALQILCFWLIEASCDYLIAPSFRYYPFDWDVS